MTAPAVSTPTLLNPNSASVAFACLRAASKLGEGIRSVNAGHVFVTETSAVWLAENFAAVRTVGGSPLHQTEGYGFNSKARC